MDQELNKAVEVHKPTRKEIVLHEVRAILAMIVYLAVSLSIIGTFRSLVMAQHGINNFVHCYIVAGILAIALAKIVVLAQKLPIMSAYNHRPLMWSVLYKATLMTIMANFGGMLEEKIFPRLSHLDASTTHSMVLTFTHQFSMMCIFIVLFIWRDIDRVLGPGTLFRLFFFPRESAASPPPTTTTATSSPTTTPPSSEISGASETSAPPQSTEG